MCQLSLAFVACTPGAESDSNDPRFDAVVVEASVSEALARFRVALNAADYDNAANMYADDERFFWVEDGSIRYESREAVRAALAQVEQFGAATYDYGPARIEVLDQDTALVYTEVTTTIGDPAAGGFAFSVA